MQDYTNFKVKGIQTDTVSVADYSMVGDKVARVIISFTGEPTKRKITEALVRKFNGLAAPVEGSFRLLNASTAVGYVKANKEVRVADEKQIKASYKVVSNNILVSTEDESLWEVKKGGDSLYLARHGQEDLADIVQSVLATNTSTPHFNMVASVLPTQNEVAAYVTENGDLDYGFVTKVGSKRAAIVSHVTKKPVLVPADRIVASYEVEVDAKVDKQIRKNLLVAEAKEDAKATMEDYYKQLYSYDKEYMDRVIEQINQLSFV